MALMVSETKLRNLLSALLRSIYERPDVGMKSEEFVNARVDEIIERCKEFP